MFIISIAIIQQTTTTIIILNKRVKKIKPNSNWRRIIIITGLARIRTRNWKEIIGRKCFKKSVWTIRRIKGRNYRQLG